MHGIPHCVRNDTALGMTPCLSCTPSCHAHHLVMLSGAKHPCTGFLTALGMTKKSARNDIFGLVMLNEVKHPCFPDLSC
jgi:hypothetical protein